MMWYLGLIVFLLFLTLPLTLLFQSSPTTALFIFLSLLFAKFYSQKQQENKPYQKAAFHHRPGTNLHAPKITLPSSSPYPSSSPPPKKHIIFYHGMLGSGRFWETLTSRLTTNTNTNTNTTIDTITTPDLLGFGRSPWPVGSHHYSMDEHCAWLIRDTLPPPPSQQQQQQQQQQQEEEEEEQEQEQEEIHLIGHSMGSLMALEVANRLPPHLKLGSITVISMPFFETKKEAQHALQQSFIPNLFIKFPTPTYFLCSILCQQRWLWSPPLSYFLSFITSPFPHHHIPQPVIEDFFLHSCESASETMHQCILNHSITTTTKTLKQKNTKIHVIHGENDPTTCPKKAKKFADLYGFSYHGIKKGGHLVPLHSPEAVSEVVREGVEGRIEEGTWKEYERR